MRYSRYDDRLRNITVSRYHGIYGIKLSKQGFFLVDKCFYSNLIHKNIQVDLIIDYIFV